MSAKAKQEEVDLEMKLVAMKLTIEDLCAATSPTQRMLKKRRGAVNVGMEYSDS